MAVTYKLIETVTVGSGGAASIEFGSIPQTYTDLKVVISARSNQANIFGTAALELNGVTSAYSTRRLNGDGSGANSGTHSVTTSITTWDMNGGSSTASLFSNVEIYIPNYAGSTNKSVSIDAVIENNATTAYATLLAGLWSNTAAITSVKITAIGNTIQQYSSASLYGIKNS